MAPLRCAAKFDPFAGAILGKEGIKFCHLATLSSAAAPSLPISQSVPSRSGGESVGDDDVEDEDIKESAVLLPPCPVVDGPLLLRRRARQDNFEERRGGKKRREGDRANRKQAAR